MCHPKAAGSCSNEQYSDTVRVKLLNAIPRKKPQMNNHNINWLNSVCSAITAKAKRIEKESLEFILNKRDLTLVLVQYSLDRVTPTNNIETKNIKRFLIWNRSQIGGKTIRAAISEIAVTDKQ